MISENDLKKKVEIPEQISFVFLEKYVQEKGNDFALLRKSIYR